MGVDDVQEGTGSSTGGIEPPLSRAQIIAQAIRKKDAATVKNYMLAETPDLPAAWAEAEEKTDPMAEQVVQALIRMGCDDTYAALYTAIRAGVLSLVQALVDACGTTWDINAITKDHQHKTPLMLAVSLGKQDIIQFLVDHFVGVIDIDKTEAGLTALHHAICKKRMQAVQLLVQKGASLNRLTSPSANEKITVLLYAMKENQYEIFQALIQHGADIYQPCVVGCRPITHLLYAVRFRDDPYVATLLETTQKDAQQAKEKVKQYLDTPDEMGKTALSWAASLGAATHVNALMGAGAAVTTQDQTGKTPLINAVIHCANMQVIHALVQDHSGSAAINMPDHAGKTALYWAAAQGKTDMVRFLLQAHARIDLKDKWGMTPFHAAVVGGHADVVAQLVAQGIVYGLNPFVQAAWHGHWQLWEVLRPHLDPLVVGGQVMALISVVIYAGAMVAIASGSLAGFAVPVATIGMALVIAAIGLAYQIPTWRAAAKENHFWTRNGAARLPRLTPAIPPGSVPVPP